MKLFEEFVSKMIEVIPENIFVKCFTYILGTNAFSDKMMNIKNSSQVIINPRRPATRILGEFFVRNGLFGILFYIINFTYLLSILNEQTEKIGMKNGAAMFLAVIIAIELIGTIWFQYIFFRNRLIRIGVYVDSELYKKYIGYLVIWIVLMFLPVIGKGYFNIENLWITYWGYIIIYTCFINKLMKNDAKENIISFHIKAHDEDEANIDISKDVKIICKDRIEVIDLATTQIYIDSKADILLYVDGVKKKISRKEVISFNFKNESFRCVNNKWVKGTYCYEN